MAESHPRQSGLTFRLLGPLAVQGEDDPLPLGAPKQRLLLALLLLNANDVVSREAAVDCLWAEDPPARAETALQVYVHNLRRSVGRERIVTWGTGYLLRAETDEIDTLVFERLLAEGRAALAAATTRARRPCSSAPSSSGAARRWPGLPFVPFVAVERERLGELRLVAEELCQEARLALGEHVALIPELSAFVGQHPYRERAWSLLMLALYRAGRQSEALETYRRAHAKLGDELGIEPSPPLRELERAILRHDPSLGLERPARRGATPRPPESRDTARRTRARDRGRDRALRRESREARDPRRPWRGRQDEACDRRRARARILGCRRRRLRRPREPGGRLARSLGARDDTRPRRRGRRAREPRGQRSPRGARQLRARARRRADDRRADRGRAAAARARDEPNSAAPLGRTALHRSPARGAARRHPVRGARPESGRRSVPRPGPRRRSAPSSSPPRTGASSPTSAGCWTGCRWRSSSPPPGASS